MSTRVGGRRETIASILVEITWKICEQLKAKKDVNRRTNDTFGCPNGPALTGDLVRNVRVDRVLLQLRYKILHINVTLELDEVSAVRGRLLRKHCMVNC